MSRFLWLLFALVVFGCAKQASPEAAYYGGDGYGYGGGGYADDYDAGGVAMAESAPARMSAGGGGRSSKNAGGPPPPPPPAPPPGVMEAPADYPQPEPVEAQSEPTSPERMVHYEGYARIRVTKPEELLAQVEALALEIGGRVDQRYGTVITIRVPVAAFDGAWEKVIALGDVLDRSVRADDVTEQFLAVDLRVKTLRTTRDRLIELLALTKKEQEKLRLLQEITRVSEELDAFETQLRVLGELASMSSITVEAVPREQFVASARPEHDGFRWIAALSPFRRAVFDDDHRIALDAPAGLVALTKKGPFVAESADGAVLWTLRLPNDPEGTGDFWVAAVQDRLQEQFANANRRAVGSWSCVEFDQAGADEPYRWQVCLMPQGRHLWLAQAFLPGAEQVTRYGAGIDAALQTVGGGA